MVGLEKVPLFRYFCINIRFKGYTPNIVKDYVKSKATTRESSRFLFETNIPSSLFYLKNITTFALTFGTS